MGNFLTTFLHRLPNKITIYDFNKSVAIYPFCSLCKHPLKFYEFLPVLSWASTLGRCNYCHSPIDRTYTIIEVLAGILSIWCYHYFAFSDDYIVLFTLGLIMLLQFFIYWQHTRIELVLILATVAFGVLYRTLVDGTISEWVSTFCLGCFASMLLLKSEILKSDAKREGAALLLQACALLGFNALPLFGLLSLMIIALGKMLKGQMQRNIYPISLTILLFMVYYYAM